MNKVPKHKYQITSNSKDLNEEQTKYKRLIKH